MLKQPQRLSRIERSFPLYEWFWEKRCEQSPEAWVVRQRKLEPRWGPAQGRAGARKGGAVHRDPARFHRKQERKSENSPASLFLCLQSLPGLLIALTYQESKNKRACENSQGRVEVGLRPGQACSLHAKWKEIVFNRGLGGLSSMGWQRVRNDLAITKDEWQWF